MDKLNNINFSLNQRIRGLKSGICRSATSTVREEENVSSTKTDHSTKLVGTVIEGIVNKDIVVVNDHRGQFFTSQRYFGNHLEQKCTGSLSHMYAESASHRVPCSQSSQKENQRRAKFIDDVIQMLHHPLQMKTKSKFYLQS